MEQPKETLSQQVQVQEKTETMQKVVLGVGMLCAFFTLINFAAVFGVGAKNLADKLADQNLNWNNAVITKVSDETRDNQVQLSVNRNLNNLATYQTGQQNVDFFAINLTNTTSSPLRLTNIKYLAYVYGGSATTSASTTPYFTPGVNYSDIWVSANNLAGDLNLFKYDNGNYVQINATSSSIDPTDGYHLTFSGLSLIIPPTSSTSTASSTVTLMVRGNIGDQAPYGAYADYIAFDLENARTNVEVYRQGQRVSVGPDNINNSNYPFVYHQITVPAETPTAPTNLQGSVYSLQATIWWWEGFYILPNAHYHQVEYKPASSLIWLMPPNGQHITNNAFSIYNLSPYTTYQFHVNTCYNITNNCSVFTNPINMYSGDPPVPPIIDFYADPTQISYGATTTLYWSVTGATSTCNASSQPYNNQWTGWRASGQNLSQPVGNLTTTTNFYLGCPGLGGTYSTGTATVIVSN